MPEPPKTEDLRPLTAGRLLDWTCVIYRSHRALFTGLVAFPAAMLVGWGTLWTALPRLASPGVGKEPFDASGARAQAAIILIGLVIGLIVVFGLVHEAPLVAHAGWPSGASPIESLPQAARLARGEFDLVEAFLQRRTAPGEATRGQAAGRIARLIAARLGDVRGDPVDPERLLEAVARQRHRGAP